MTVAEQSEQNPAYRLGPTYFIIIDKLHQMIKRNYSTKLTAFSQILRKNMTPEEKHLWYNYLKKLPLTVHRQKVIDCYIVDFYIASAKLVIELDGSQHFTAKGKASDSARDSHLHKLGLTVLRYSNADIAYRFESVCADIDKHIQNASIGS